MATIVDLSKQERLDKIQKLRQNQALRMKALPKPKKPMRISQQLQYLRGKQQERELLKQEDDGEVQLTAEEISSLNKFVVDNSVRVLSLPMQAEQRALFQENLKANPNITNYISRNVLSGIMQFTSVLNEHTRFLYNYGIEYDKSRKKSEVEELLEKREKERNKRKEEEAKKQHEESHISELEETDEENTEVIT